MNNKWDGVPRDEASLKFWSDSYIAMVTILMANIAYTSTVQDNSTIPARLLAANEVASKMFEHYQSMRELMEDYTAR